MELGVFMVRSTGQFTYNLDLTIKVGLPIFQTELNRNKNQANIGLDRTILNGPISIGLNGPRLKKNLPKQSANMELTS